MNSQELTQKEIHKKVAEADEMLTPSPPSVFDHLDWKDRIILLDGGLGTMLQQSGVRVGKIPELMNITHPEIVSRIHRAYVKSGSDIIYTNTLCANGYKLQDCNEEGMVARVIEAGVALAKKATKNTKVLSALSVGPIGEMLEPNGGISMEEVYEFYREVVVAGEQAGADLVVFETMTDLLEAKTAILAAKENTQLPIFCTMTFEENQRTFTGVSLSSMAITLTGLGVDAIGINCSLGPAEIFPLAMELRQWTDLPLIIKPNAGLPNLDADTFDMGAEEFVQLMEKYISCGVQFLGGCCGTTPEYIALMKERFNKKLVVQHAYEKKAAVCSANHTVVLDGVRVIGERINPTGKKRFQQALIHQDINYILTQGLEQVQVGVDILDVNVGLPEIDEKKMMVQVIKQLQSVVDTPLQIDSSDPEVLEAALRVVAGKAIVNSVNGEQVVMDRIFPLVKKYGAGVVGLTVDEQGIPTSAEQRFNIAKKITDCAKTYGISSTDIFIDCLTLTASVQPKQVLETLNALRRVKQELGVQAVLGISNISFGLPNRELVNQSFLTLAMSYGLNCPMMNPNVKAMMDAVDAFQLLNNHDKGAVGYIARQANQPIGETKVSSVAFTDEESLQYAVEKGLKQQAHQACMALLQYKQPLDIVHKILIPTLDQVGIAFEKGEIFLPQLIQSAVGAQAAFDDIRTQLLSQSSTKTISKGTVLLATVKGDVHDIGKNIVKVVLQNYGYDVIDLGKDVAIERVVQEAIRTQAQFVGLSALMTTTVVQMENTIQALHKVQHLLSSDLKIVVGGAVLTKDYAMKIGADFYAKDAKQSVDIAKVVFGHGDE